MADRFDDLLVLAELRDAVERAARAPERALPPRRPRAAGRRPALVLALLVGACAAGSAAAATAVVLRASVIEAPDPRSLPPEQTPLAGTARVAPPRAADPLGGPPVALRVARGSTGLTCTTIGQVRDGEFGLVGIDGRFRRLPAGVSDACGERGTLVGARVLDAPSARDLRSVVFGVAGPRLRRATLTTTSGPRPLAVGAGGTFVAVVRGRPEDRALSLGLRFADGRTERHDLGRAPGLVPDPGGGGAWRIETLRLGTRLRCAQIVEVVASGGARHDDPYGGRARTPTACVAREGGTAVAAEARTLRPGDRGRPGFDRWRWGRREARTVVWGTASGPGVVRSVAVLGVGAARRARLADGGTFGAVLDPVGDPEALRLRVRLAGGRTRVIPVRRGLVPDPVEGRRP